MTAPSLTERYLWAASREMPAAQRAEFRRELAERIGDDVDARVEAGASPADAEYAALVELGDPVALAASYRDRPLQLIGPRLYPVWLRLLRVLAATVLPSVAGGFVLAQSLAQRPAGEIVGTTFVVLLTVTVHLGFWTTLVFAVLDRANGGAGLTDWKPEHLPAAVESPAPSLRSDFIANLVFIVLLAAAIVLHPLWLPFRDEAGAVVPLVRPETWAWLEWYLLALLAAELVLWIVLVRHGRWNLWFAAVHTLLAAAFAAPAVALLADGRFFDAEFLARTGWADGATLLGAGGVLSVILCFAVVGCAAIGVVDGFVKSFRDERGAVRPVAG